MARVPHLVELAAERLRGSGQASVLLLEPTRAPETGNPATPPPPQVIPLADTPTDPRRVRRDAGGLPSKPQITINRPRLEKAGLVRASAGSRSRPVEQFRIIQGQLFRATDGVAPKPNVLMITSAKPGEGKSFTALNLAATLAECGRGDVILVDTDARHGCLTDRLDVAASPGLLDLARDPSLQIQDLLLPTAIDRLTFLPIGDRAADTDSGQAAQPIVPSLDRLGALGAGMIVLDAPPCLAASEPSIFAPHAGIVILVVQAQSTQRWEVEASLELLQACPAVALVLNKIEVEAAAELGSYL